MPGQLATSAKERHSVVLAPCDYLLVGAGAMSLSFADTLLTERPDATVVFVDDRPRPGGHWVDSYAFVRLHQPASFYGVSSEVLERSAGDLAELTPGPEVQRYFERVMKKYVAAGRARYFPLCTFDRGAASAASHRAGDTHAFHSMGQGDGDGELVQYSIRVNCKLVDAAFLTAVTPSTRPPPFPVASDTRIVGVAGIHDLSALPPPRPSEFIVVGAGKTGMDAVMHLLDGGVDQESITWIVPNDSLMLDRDVIFFGAELKTQFPTLVLDEAVPPKNFKCATVNPSELGKLRQIRRIVRKGRVRSATANHLELEHGRIDLVSPGTTLLVDCTSNGLTHKEAVPVFHGDMITLQSVLLCQPTHSAAIIGHIECKADLDEDERNGLCTPVPHPEKIEDLLPALARSAANRKQFDEKIGDWMKACRLNTDLARKFSRSSL